MELVDRAVLQPVVKWTGSKRSQATAILEQAPVFRRYIEPFVGGGAVLGVAAHPGAIAGDIYEPLIELWRLIRDKPDSVADAYQDDWHKLHADLPDYYYSVRDRFNASPGPTDLCFLTRTCVNGFIRFNSAGEFNNSFHLSRPGISPSRFRKIVKQWSERLRDVEFVAADYAQTLSAAEEGDFVYLDPPYVGNRARYAATGVDIDALVENLRDLNKRRVWWALSLDGSRGLADFAVRLPSDLYVARRNLSSGNSPAGKVLNKNVEPVTESLFTNY